MRYWRSVYLYIVSFSGGVLHDQSNSPFTFSSQETYNEVAKAVKAEVYSMMKQAGLKEILLPLESLLQTSTVNIFATDGVKKFVDDGANGVNKLLLLIHGSGNVRAGQWSRRYNLCMLYNLYLIFKSFILYIQESSSMTIPGLEPCCRTLSMLLEEDMM
jgi:hypothetical protein